MILQVYHPPQKMVDDHPASQAMKCISKGFIVKTGMQELVELVPWVGEEEIPIDHEDLHPSKKEMSLMKIS